MIVYIQEYDDGFEEYDACKLWGHLFKPEDPSDPRCLDMICVECDLKYAG